MQSKKELLEEEVLRLVKCRRNAEGRFYVSDNGEKIEMYTEFLYDSVHSIVSRFDHLEEIVFLLDSDAKAENITCLLRIMLRDAKRQLDELFLCLTNHIGEIEIDRAVSQPGYIGGHLLGAAVSKTE